MNTMEFTRFDVPDAFGLLIEKALELDIVDGKDLIVLMVNYHMRWDRIVDEIVNYAYCSRHCNDTHNIIVPYVDKFWADVNKSIPFDR